MYKEEQVMNTYYKSKANSLALPTGGIKIYLLFGILGGAQRCLAMCIRIY